MRDSGRGDGLMSPRRLTTSRWLRSLIACLCGCGAVMLWSAPAQAGIVHVFAGTFGSEGSGSGQFKSPVGIAVNDSTHDVYVADRGNKRVEEFNSTGSAVLGEFNGSAAPTGPFAEPTGIAVDNSEDPLDPSAGDVYVIDAPNGVIDKFTAAGAYVGQLTGICEKAGESPPCGKSKFIPFGRTPGNIIGGVAVDPSGGVWVSVNGAIDVFTDGAANGFVSALTDEYGQGYGLAVDSESDVYLRVGSNIAKLNGSGETLIHQFGPTGESLGVAFDPAERKVYVTSGNTAGTNSISVFTSSGAPVERFGSGDITLGEGVAIDSSSGTVYFADRELDRVALFDAVRLPTVTMGALSEQTPRSATLNGSVNPEGVPVTSCVFEYDTKEYAPGEASHGKSVPCSPANPGSGTSAVPVTARLTGLMPQVRYHYRLVAANKAGSSDSPDQELFTGPRLGEEFATDVTSSTATVNGSVDPNGGDTHYYFEYGRTAAYDAYAPAPPPGVDIGSAAGGQSASVHLRELAPGALYHYRIVAVQDGEAFEGPDLTFTTQPAGEASALPDGRYWELVSPAEKHGALIEEFEGSADQIQAASDGSGIFYPQEGPSAGENPQSKTRWSQVLSRRGPSGWRSQDLTLPMALPAEGESALERSRSGQEYLLFSPDLSLAVVEPQIFGTPLLSPQATERTLYLRNNADGAFLPLLTPSDLPPGTRIEEPPGEYARDWALQFLAATPDLSHVLFETPVALLPEAVQEDKECCAVGKKRSGEPQWNLYEWSAGKLQLVNVLPNGEATRGEAPPLVTLAGQVRNESTAKGGGQREVSSDGRWVAWSWGQAARNFFAEYKGLYVRDMVEERTVKVGGPRAEFQTMNSSGSRIFFTENGELYEFDTETDAQTDLTVNHAAGEGAGVQSGVSDVSEDGSYVYFVADGVLAEGAVPGGCANNKSSIAVTCNLYVVHYNGSEWERPRLVAVLSGADEPSWYADAFAGAMGLERVSSRVSPDGRYLAFMSQRSLTGYDNTDAVSGKPDEEVYLYDAAAGRLTCASCNPTGARPRGVFDNGRSLLVDRNGMWGGAKVNEDHWLAGSLRGWDESQTTGATYQPRYLSDGGRLFFDSPDALAAQDTNGLEDVYEYEPSGTGSCTNASSAFSERLGGCVSLISSGTAGAESAFFDASEGGNDAFFLTAGRLSPADFDTSLDVYDAHVCTASAPCLQAPVSPPPCSSGDSCKPAPSPQPEIFGPAPTATFSGIGNFVPGKASSKRKPLTRAQKLARALKACRRKRSPRARRVCERLVRKRYAARRPRSRKRAQRRRGR